MATRIVTKSGSGAPTTDDLIAGELAVDLTNKRLYTEDSGGTVLEVGSNPYNFTANHDGSVKLATTATGIDVTGTVTADGLSVDGASSGSTVATFTANANVDTPLLVFQRSGGAVAGKIAYDDTNTAINFGTTTNHEVRFLTNNTEKMQLTADGNLGIGVSPTLPLSVDGDIWQGNTSGVEIGRITNAAGWYDFGGSSNVNGAQMSHASTLRFVTNTAEAMRIDSSGNVGIGTSSPASPTGFGSSGILHLKGATGNDCSIVLEGLSGSGGRQEIGASGGALQFYRGAATGSMSESMRIDASGNVGIGITSSLEKFTVANTSSGIVGRFTNNTNQTLDLGVISGYGAAGGVYYNNANSGYHAFQTGATERMRIDSSGNVGIGCSPSAPLHVDAAGMGDIYSGLIENTTTDTDHYNVVRFMQGASGSATGFIGTGGSTTGNPAFRNTFAIGTQSANSFVLATNDTERMRIDASGTVKISHADTASEGLRVIQTTAGRTSGGALGLFYDDQAGTTQPTLQVIQNGTGDILQLFDGASQAVTVQDGGNLLVGNTVINPASGFSNQKGFGYAGSTGKVEIATTANDAVMELGKNNATDGNLIVFRKQGASVGSIGVDSTRLTIGSASASGLRFDGANVMPTSSGSLSDGTVDIGYSANRFKDLYRSGSTISTSDRNMKQDERDLSEAETRVAQACKGLLKAFRFKDAVQVDGDGARIHFGIIAQDLQAAFETEGLDATKYAMFRPSTLTDDEGDEQVRLGVCYENLLAFIIAAI